MATATIWDLLTDARGFFVAGEPVRIWENPDAPLHVDPKDFQNAVDEGDWVRAFNVVTLVAALDVDEESLAPIPELPVVSAIQARFGS